MNIKYYYSCISSLITANWHQRFRLNFSINNVNMYYRNLLNPYFSIEKLKNITNLNLLYIMANDEEEKDDLDFGYGFNNFQSFEEEQLYQKISLQYAYSKIILKVHKSRRLSEIFEANQFYTIMWESEFFFILDIKFEDVLNFKKLERYIVCFCSSINIINSFNQYDFSSCKLDVINHIINHFDIVLCKVDFFGNSNFLLYTKEIFFQNQIEAIFNDFKN